jgi:dTDP-4-dehydrorhamnose reductase/UDP-glucose 4-epimerase
MSFFQKNKKIKILAIGKNSFLAKNFYKYTKLKKNINFISRYEIEKINFDEFTHLINFSYDPKILNQNYHKTNLIDKKICSLIKNDKLIYIYLSSRAVLKIDNKRKNYGINKSIIEKLIKKNRKRRYLILRISNVLGFNLEGSNLFITKLLNSLKMNKLIKLDLHKKTYKDFITPMFFSESLDKLIIMNKTGTFNFSSGKKIYIDELCKAIIKGYGEGKIIYLKNLYRDSFTLNNSKLINFTNIDISKEEIINFCYSLGKKLRRYA